MSSRSHLDIKAAYRRVFHSTEGWLDYLQCETMRHFVDQVQNASEITVMYIDEVFSVILLYLGSLAAIEERRPPKATTSNKEP